MLSSTMMQDGSTHMMVTITFYVALVATLGAVLCVVLYNWSLKRELTAHLDLAQEWQVVLAPSEGVYAVKSVKLVPRGQYYWALYGKTKTRHTNPHLAVVNLIHKLQWEVESVRHPYQSDIVSDAIQHCADECGSVVREYMDLADAGGGKGFTAEECEMIAEGAGIAKRRIQGNASPWDE